ncbi:restriction endonuclease [Clostridium phage HM T]|uniref:Restriction endonuclease n=1 Tax=Clostridium saccharoperbutylacetonicum N1-4(HMT) TaxID=931276 RepID=M1MEJ9_9CLOT|nr:restriction endonuclease [Clostridium saccharoperbutylacetonicum]AMB17431.1 restriction endonuclease [Clostridium phage HM T]AGF54783.1 restriction endonuclease [Clostridium saccharoperbutylacetonicum N1-4(HMT)]NRT58696.1 hypothetical protein [Clostridium saccharoperbutylacetonicum]NSB27885.1 hypothetical protein [Clostridium saccharoperbutylacetonicum]NSB41368.1 hypothetical protein [Clostridium saccharoperbutylacetonicum]
MFNYSNLDDIELEELCKDVMERMLNIKFRSFRAGVDGGIDLKDYDSENNIIVQVKHYINSTVPMLKSSLKKEVEKVDKLNPNEYYVCCTKELGPNDIKDIYNLFKKYMDSEKNIITLKEIDDLLREERNIDIVRKHYKLWLYSSNILSEINNQNTFIDCETLLSDINNESKYYVRTQAYDIGIDILEKFGSLILAGSPGVGKTTISKMIILYYATLGYRVRYTTNGDIDNIKKSLSVDRELNEIILLDDCLGQYYFKIKESQQRELIDIIKYVNNNKSKKIILNSRITILNQAQKKSQEFENFVINKKVRIHVMDMDNISLVEKARILYNHLYFNNVSKEYYDSIKNNKNYNRIISHRNYNPRIIEYVTQKERYKNIEPSEYFDFILSYLDNPQEIWRIEYEERIDKIDRLFMLTLFSLTDTTISESVIEECFNKRILESAIDTTVNNFKDTIIRLNKSMIKIIDNNGTREISVLNPSVNDYLKSIFYENSAELERIRESIVYFDQIKRCYSKDSFDEAIKERIDNNRFLCLKINKLSNMNIVNIQTLWIYYICKYKILDEKHKQYIHNYIENIDNESFKDDENIRKRLFIYNFLEEPFFNFYNIDQYVIKKEFITKIYYSVDLEDLVSLVNGLYDRANNEFLYDFYDISVSCIQEEFENYIDKFNISNFIGDLDFNRYSNGNYYDEFELDEDGIYSDVKDAIIAELEEIIENIKYNVIRDIEMVYINNINFDEYNLKEHVLDAIELKKGERDYDDDYEYERYREDRLIGTNYNNEIENIFNRDFNL